MITTATSLLNRSLVARHEAGRRSPIEHLLALDRAPFECRLSFGLKPMGVKVLQPLAMSVSLRCEARRLDGWVHPSFYLGKYRIRPPGLNPSKNCENLEHTVPQ